MSLPRSSRVPKLRQARDRRSLDQDLEAAFSSTRYETLQAGDEPVMGSSTLEEENRPMPTGLTGPAPPSTKSLSAGAFQTRVAVAASRAAASSRNISGDNTAAPAGIAAFEPRSSTPGSQLPQRQLSPSYAQPTSASRRRSSLTQVPPGPASTSPPSPTSPIRGMDESKAAHLSGLTSAHVSQGSYSDYRTIRGAPASLPPIKERVRAAAAQATAPVHVSSPLAKGSLSPEEMARTLPRGFDSATLSKGSAGQRRARLPSSFMERSTSLEEVVPLRNPYSENPSVAQRHATISEGVSRPHWEVLPRTRPASPLGSPTIGIPPTPPLAEPARPSGSGLPSARDTTHSALVSQSQAVRAHYARTKASSEDFGDEDDSSGSTPTPTGRSTADSATSAYPGPPELELIPVQLFHPSQLPQLPMPGGGSAQRSDSTGPLNPPPDSPPRANHPPRTQRAVAMSVSSSKSSARRSSIMSDGREVHLVRTDFQNMRRFSVSKPSTAASSSVSTGLQQRSAPTAVAMARQVSPIVPGTTQQTSPPASSSPRATSRTLNVPSVAASPSRDAIVSRASRTVNAPQPSNVAATAANRSATEQSAAQAKRKPVPTVGGHLLSDTNVGILPRKDGTARLIYSPTPQTLAAARKGQELAQMPGASAPGVSGAKGANPVPHDALPPPTPQLDQYHLRFRRSEPALATPEASRPGTGVKTPPDGSRSGAVDDTAVAKASRNTFGPDSTFFDQASVMLAEVQRRRLLEERRARRNNRAGAVSQSTVDDEPGPSDPSKRRSIATSNRRSSIGSATTMLDSPILEQHVELQRSLSGRKEEKMRSMSSLDLRLSADRERTGVSGLVVPSSEVPEAHESSAASAADNDNDDAASTDTQFDGVADQLIINTQDHGNSAQNRLQHKSSFMRFIPISPTITRRPGTGQTRFSFRTTRSRRAHGSSPACRVCFRAGFDCAMNLQLGEGTEGRKAFQDFVNAGGLAALSVREGTLADGTESMSVSMSQALGHNYINKLGEVAFGESATSRPVTRGMVELMLEEQGGPQDRYEPTLHEGSEEIVAEQAPSMNAHSTLGPFRAKSARRSGAPLSALLAEQRSASHSSLLSEQDDLEFMADRWSDKRKCWHMLVLFVNIFSLQCLDSGYVSAIPVLASSLHTTPIATTIGGPMFNWGQALGILFAGGLSVLGRRRIALASTISVGILSVIAGFTSSLGVLIALRLLIGLCAGAFVTVAIGTVLDIFIRSGARIAALVLLILVVAVGQIVGPWIATLVINLTSWSWLYWATLAESVVVTVLIGATIGETSPILRFRNKMAIMRRKGGIVTPQAPAAPTLAELLVHHLPKPFYVLFAHKVVMLSAITSTFFLSVYVFVISDLAGVWQEQHKWSGGKAGLAFTLCVVVGLMVAVLAIWMLSIRQADPHRRTLHIDEKGFIDATSPTLRPETKMVWVSIGAAAFVIALYFLALTSRPTLSWVFGALSLTIMTAGLIILELGLLQYLLDSYQPARGTILSDVLSFHDDNISTMSMDPYTVQSRPVGRQSRHAGSTLTVVPEKDQEGDASWGSTWALNAVAILYAISVASATATFIPAGPTFVKLGFQTTTIILASASCVACVLPYILFRFGERLRTRARNSFEDRQHSQHHQRSRRRSSSKGYTYSAPVPGFGSGPGPIDHAIPAIPSRGLKAPRDQVQVN